MRPSARINNDSFALIGGTMNTIDHVALVVRLIKAHANTEGFSAFAEHILEVLERHGSVNSRFPFAQPIQVGAVGN